jgi:hypothetical protein
VTICLLTLAIGREGDDALPLGRAIDEAGIARSEYDRGAHADKVDEPNTSIAYCSRRAAGGYARRSSQGSASSRPSREEEGT